jgi:hypothetical protein
VRSKATAQKTPLHEGTYATYFSAHDQFELGVGRQYRNNETNCPMPQFPLVFLHEPNPQDGLEIRPVPERERIESG